MFLSQSVYNQYRYIVSSKMSEVQLHEVYSGLLIVFYDCVGGKTMPNIHSGIHKNGDYPSLPTRLSCFGIFALTNADFTQIQSGCICLN